MKALRIGLVDLDTSHPGQWIPIMRDLGHHIAGVYDSGTVYDDGYAERFAKQHSVDRVFHSLDDMAAEIDVAVIHSCNWDLHVQHAIPFVKAGKKLLFDKPIAGNVKDIQQILAWEKEGICITGGSSLSYCQEVKRWRSARSADDHIIYAVAGCSVDEFNYGIHAYALLQAIMGPGIESVRCLGTHIQHQIELEWKDGRKGFVHVGATNGYLPFYSTIVTESNVSHLVIDNRQLYRTFLEDCLDYLQEEAKPAMPLQDLVEAELAAIAALNSRFENGKRIALADLTSASRGYNGVAFAQQYRRGKKG